jgi:hypothetical protein
LNYIPILLDDPTEPFFFFLFRGSSDGCGFDGAIVQRLDWAIVGFEADREGAQLFGTGRQRLTEDEPFDVFGAGRRGE